MCAYVHKRTVGASLGGLNTLRRKSSERERLIRLYAPICCDLEAKILVGPNVVKREFLEIVRCT